MDPRILYTSVVVLLGTLLGASWATQYLPQERRLSQHRERLAHAKRQVKEIETFLEEAGGEILWRQQHELALERLRQKLPSSRQVPRLLDALVREVSRVELRLVNVTQGNLEGATDAQGQPILVNGVPCQALPATLQVEGRFRDVLNYLKVLESHNFPCVVRVEDVTFDVKAPMSSILKTSLRLRLYVL